MIECKICGNMFETDDRRYKCCSAKCSKINQQQHIRRWRKEHREEERERQRGTYIRNPNQTDHFCRICGEPIRWSETKHPVQHDECVLNEIVKRINSGKKMTDAQYQQLVARGYDLGMFAEEYRKVLKHYPTVAYNKKRKK